jgi:hypothetical protein
MQEFGLSVGKKKKHGFFQCFFFFHLTGPCENLLLGDCLKEEKMVFSGKNQFFLRLTESCHSSSRQ